MEKEERPVSVLLIEDNVGFAYGVRDMLVRQSRLPFVVTQAGTLAEGIAVLKEGRPDVVLLDLGLPDSDRLDTFNRLHSEAPNVPVVILTVLDDDGVAVRALRDGGQDYLVKDKVSMDLLVRSIRYAIERNAIERDLRNLSARVLAAQDEERRRIARDLHEVTGQSLTVLSMNLGLVMQHSGSMSREDRRLLAEAAVLASKCSDELRTTAYLLHPPMLEELGLAGAVRDYADGFARRSGIRVDLELPEQMPGISGDMQIALFRVMQECLANIHRHSGSRTASILFVVQRDGIELTVRDCGRGMPHVGPEGSHAALGVGIAGMRERLAQLGGRLDISAEPGKGTVVRALLPLRKEATQ